MPLYSQADLSRVAGKETSQHSWKDEKMSAAHTLPQSPAINSRRTKKQVSYTSLFLPVPWLPWDALLGHTTSLPPQSFAGGAIAGGREEVEKQLPGALLAPSWTNCLGSNQGQTYMSFWIWEKQASPPDQYLHTQARTTEKPYATLLVNLQWSQQ